MNLEISKYLHQYLKVNFSTYCEHLNKKDFMSFVNAIASNPLLNKISVDEVKNGYTDKTINQLVEKYAQLKFPELWKEKVYNYLDNYIQGKFPMYHKFISKEEFNSFIDSITLDPIMREYGLFALLEGQINKTVDKLVEDYAQLKLTNVWANFGNLSNYIKNVITQTYGNDMLVINDKTLDDIVKKIADGFIRDNGDYSYYMNGAYDRIFLTSFDAHCDKIKKDCSDLIKDIIEKSQLKVMYGKSTYDDIVEKVMNDILNDYDIDEIIFGKYDVEVLEKFKFYCDELRRKVSSYIKKTVNDIDFLSGIPVDIVVSDITKKVETGELNVNQLFNGGYDQFIESYSNEKRVARPSKNNDRMQERINPVEYIRNYIIENLDVDRSISNEDFDKCSIYIYRCMSIPTKNRDRGLTPEEIVSPMYASEIVRYYNRYMMKKNSTERGNVPKRIKPKKRKRFFQKSVSALLLTATLLGVFGTGAVLLDKGVEKYKESVHAIAVEIKTPVALDEFDDYGYTYIFSKVNDAVKPTALNILKFHSKVQAGEYNDLNYDYLGFYRAYENVREDRLYIMDAMLNIVKDEVSKNESGSEFQKNVSSASCYLEFAMDRLEDMGCKEINNQKYHNVLFEYLKIKNEHPNDEVLQYMNDIDRKYVKNIMEKYQEYSEKMLKEFGEIIQEEKDGAKVSLLSGRRI